MDQQYQYQYNNPETVTFIDQLPDIETLEGMNNNGMGSYMENNQYNSHTYEKAYDRTVMPPSHQQLRSKLKQRHITPPESGMSAMKSVQPVNQNVVNTPALIHNQIQQMPPHMQQQMPPHMQQQMPPHMQQQMQYEQSQEHFDQTPNSYKPSCLEVAEHIKDCPICSKLYNNDNTVYIIVIVILSIICILLLKRVLDI